MKTDELQLVRSEVVFNEVDHTYTYLGQRLSGVTSLLSRTIFRDKYSGISKEVLNKAAEYGHNIHEQIEIVDSMGVTSDTPAVLDYIRIRDENKLTPVANEYLISDEDYLASSIDIIYGDKSDLRKGVELCDVKTTSKLDMEYLSWQLSIYAWLFERQNPGLKVNRLLAMWLPKPRYGRSALVEVLRKPKEAIDVLILWDKSINHQIEF